MAGRWQNLISPLCNPAAFVAFCRIGSLVQSHEELVNAPVTVT